ncbi:redox-sensitive transcriptional activator SoxR [Inhella sp.]|uniref:redox-sensitive transcriptional activator SoxR n=1 Tax=Inhella sp. TaxID=1921806 RepID=UPI0035B3791C
MSAQRARGSNPASQEGADGDEVVAGARWIAIGELAKRSGVAASALRFYEAQGLIHGSRSPGGRRQYPRHTLRRVAFLRAGQRVGLSLDELRQVLATLPDQRTPTKADWDRLARGWQALLDERLALLSRLREQLGSCIGCGCLSLKSCRLYNPGDQVAPRGPGARRLMLGEPLADVSGDRTAGQPARHR